MRKAIIVLATTVAFLLSGVAFAATRKNVNVPDTATILKGNGETLLSDGILSSVGSVIEGEYIEAGGKSTSLAVRPKALISTANITSAIKSGLKSNAGSLAITGTIAGLLAGVDWVMTDGVLMKKTQGGGGLVATDPSAGQYSWTLTQRGSTQLSGQNSATGACSAFLATSRFTSNPDIIGVRQTNSRFVSDTQYTCAYETQSKSTYSWNADSATVTRYGSSCPANSSYDSTSGGCLSTASSSSPVTDADIDSNVLDGFVRTQDGTWQRQAAKDVCDNSPNPASCYKAMAPTTSLTGPGTIQLPSTTTTSGSNTTNPDGTTSSTGTTTTTQTPSISITYGDTYYDYTTNNTTTTTNPDGTTTTTTETSDAPPDVPDALAGINDPLGGIPDEIKNQGSSGSSLPYHSWFNMGGSCKEHSFELPVIGTLTTNYCPIHEQYVRPFLYFIFALWTWHTCWSIWRENVTRVRAH